MKRFNMMYHVLFLTITILFSMIPAYGMEMEKNSASFFKKDSDHINKNIQEAKKHNKNHPLLIDTLLKTIFFYCKQDIHVPTTYLDVLYPKKRPDTPEKIAYHQIRTLLAIHTSCLFFNTLMPFTEIIEFCKPLENYIKNHLLNIALQQSYTDSYTHNFMLSALIQAGADASVQYHDHVPLFFYAKSQKIAQEVINRGKYNIHTIMLKTGSSYSSDYTGQLEFDNILSHVINKEYPSELMSFYIKEAVIPTQRTLHKLALRLKDHCANEELMFEFLKKCELLLTIAPNTVKNGLNWEYKTPLDILKEKVIFNENETHLLSFKKEVTDLFIKHECKTANALANNYCEDTDVKDSFIHEYDFDASNSDEDKIINNLISDEDNILNNIVNTNARVKKINNNNAITKKYDSLVKSVKNNNLDEMIKLIKNGHVNINERDNVEDTLLILATKTKNKEMIKCLLSHGANTELLNSLKYTALDIAMNNGDDEIAALLIDASEAPQG